MIEEMTGLEVGKHVLMEVAAIITDGNLRPVEEVTFNCEH